MSEVLNQITNLEGQLYSQHGFIISRKLTTEEVNFVDNEYPTMQLPEKFRSLVEAKLREKIKASKKYDFKENKTFQSLSMYDKKVQILNIVRSLFKDWEVYYQHNDLEIPDDLDINRKLEY